LLTPSFWYRAEAAIPDKRTTFVPLSQKGTHGRDLPDQPHSPSARAHDKISGPLLGRLQSFANSFGIRSKTSAEYRRLGRATPTRTPPIRLLTKTRTHSQKSHQSTWFAIQRSEGSGNINV
jgi:hypothetical protein